MRQRDPTEHQALAALHDGRSRQYVSWADRSGRLTLAHDPAQALRSALDEWADAAEELGADQAVLIARDNDTRSRLNSLARDQQRAWGRLGEEHTFGNVTIAVGDRVICRRNDRGVDVDNGTRGTVRHLDADKVVIETDAHQVRPPPVVLRR
jgi:ATP-dependent exoDNAse (exonuclease V) alpha subunit